jgi:hypothetical protein
VFYVLGRGLLVQRVIDGRWERVALFGGAYSNWVAVRAVLADARRRGAQQTFFLGDVGGFGPHPDRTVHVLREAGIPCVQGNYDDSVGNSRDDCACGYTDPRDNHFAQVSYDYTLANTGADSRAWLAGLPVRGRIHVGATSVHLCHGSPRRVNEFLWESTTPEGFIAHQARQVSADWIACTHTGVHWHRRVAGGGGIVNVGAVGRPANDGQRCVWYTLLEAGGSGADLQVTHVPVEYDVSAVVREMRAEGLPEPFVDTLESGWWTTCLEIMPGKERRRGRH